MLFLQALFANIEVTFRTRLKEQLLKLGITNNGSTRHGYVPLHCTQTTSTVFNQIARWCHDALLQDSQL